MEVLGCILAIHIEANSDFCYPFEGGAAAIQKSVNFPLEILNFPVEFLYFPMEILYVAMDILTS